MILLLGLNHKSAPLTVREKLAFKEEEIPGSLRRLTATPPFKEGMILSTCNRVEILARAEDRQAATAAVREYLVRERGLSPEEVERYCYLYEENEAVRHLFQVAAGLDSMVLGEPQILGQVKRAYQLAQESGATGSILEHLLQQGLSAAKRVRTETDISRNAVSISFAAVELARKIFGDLQGRSVLLLGAGKMVELAARHLVAQGISRVVVSNRTYSRAVDLAAKFGGEAVNWDRGFEPMEKVDIVVSGTAAPSTILDRPTVQRYVKARRSRPLFLIDIAVPRDIEPDVNTLDNVYLYDVDDLQGVVEANKEERQRAAEEARRMVDEEVAAFDRWRQSLAITPTIVALRETLLAVGDKEIARLRRKLGDLTPEQEKAVEELTRSVIQKILHPAIVHLKSTAQAGDPATVATLYHRIFGMETRSDSGTPAAPGGREA